MKTFSLRDFIAASAACAVTATVFLPGISAAQEEALPDASIKANALLETPDAAGLSFDAYVELARLVYKQKDIKEAVATMKLIIKRVLSSDRVSGDPETLRTTCAKLTAAMTAAIQVIDEDYRELHAASDAHDRYQALIAAVSTSFQDAVQNLVLLRNATATGTVVSGESKYAEDPSANVAAAMKEDAKAAFKSPDTILDPEEAVVLQQFFERVCENLRSSKYEPIIDLDDISVLLSVENENFAPTRETLSGSGIFSEGTITVPATTPPAHEEEEKPTPTTKPSPTPKGLI